MNDAISASTSAVAGGDASVGAEGANDAADTGGTGAVDATSVGSSRSVAVVGNGAGSWKDDADARPVARGAAGSIVGALRVLTRRASGSALDTTPGIADETRTDRSVEGIAAGTA